VSFCNRAVCLLLGVYGRPPKPLTFTSSKAFQDEIFPILSTRFAGMMFCLTGDPWQPRALTFGTSNGPFSFSPGPIEVQISQSNTLAPSPILHHRFASHSRPEASVSAVAGISSDQPTLSRLPTTCRRNAGHAPLCLRPMRQMSLRCRQLSLLWAVRTST